MNLVDKLRTSLVILRHTLQLMRRHPLLLVFPFTTLLASLLIYMFFVAPMMLSMSLDEFWYTLMNDDEHWDALMPWQAGRRSIEAAGINGAAQMPSLPFSGIAVYYLMTMLVMTFVNVALYSQAIEAINGGKVSLMRGFMVAIRKLVAIIGWTLLASTVGLVLKALQDRSWGLGNRIIAGLAGFSWSAASVFVIPVIIRESRSKSPFEYLRISSSLFQRVWGEGVMGLSGAWLVGVMILIPLITLNFAFVTLTGNSQLAFINVILAIGLVMVLHLGFQIFECGLYVYATEGVVPSSFDEDTFNRVWTVSRGAAPQI